MLAYKRRKTVLLSICMLLAVFILVPAWASAETVPEQTAQTTSEVDDESSANNTAGGSSTVVVTRGDNNKVTGIGAQAGSGIGNTALGSSVQIIDGSNNEAQSVGAQAMGGNFNTAVGTSCQVVSGNDNKVTGYGAQAGGGDHNTAIGFDAQAIGGNENRAIGTGAYANGSFNTAVGSRASALGYAATAVGAQASAVAAGSVAIGAGSVADEPDTVSVGNAEYNYQRRITNLAAGINDNDAVSVRQLRAVDTHVSYIENQVNNLDGKVNRLGATAFAMSSLAPMAYDPNQPTQYAAGIGTYNGKQALAVGIFHYSKESVLLNAAVGFSADGWEKAGRIGITWKTGPKRKKKEEPDTTVFVTNVQKPTPEPIMAEPIQTDEQVQADSDNQVAESIEIPEKVEPETVQTETSGTTDLSQPSQQAATDET